ncbi:MAG: hypothetical protein QMC67_13885 [Candidatus Wallbacteria bacterium]
MSLKGNGNAKQQLKSEKILKDEIKKKPRNPFDIPMPLKIKVNGKDKLIYIPGIFNPANYPKNKSYKIQIKPKIKSTKIKIGRISEPVRIGEENTILAVPLNIFPRYTAENELENQALDSLYKLAVSVENFDIKNYMNILKDGNSILYNPDYSKYVNILSAARYCLQVCIEKLLQTYSAPNEDVSQNDSFSKAYYQSIIDNYNHATDENTLKILNLCSAKLSELNKKLNDYSAKQSSETMLKIKELDKKIEVLINDPKQTVDYFQKQYFELNSNKLSLYFQLMGNYLVARDYTASVELIKQVDKMYDSWPSTIDAKCATLPVSINKDLNMYANIYGSFFNIMEEYGNNVKNYEEGENLKNTVKEKFEKIKDKLYYPESNEVIALQNLNEVRARIGNSASNFIVEPIINKIYFTRTEYVELTPMDIPDSADWLNIRCDLRIIGSNPSQPELEQLNMVKRPFKIVIKSEVSNELKEVVLIHDQLMPNSYKAKFQPNSDKNLINDEVKKPGIAVFTNDRGIGKETLEIYSNSKFQKMLGYSTDDTATIDLSKSIFSTSKSFLKSGGAEKIYVNYNNKTSETFIKHPADWLIIDTHGGILSGTIIVFDSEHKVLFRFEPKDIKNLNNKLQVLYLGACKCLNFKNNLPCFARNWHENFSNGLIFGYLLSVRGEMIEAVIKEVNNQLNQIESKAELTPEKTIEIFKKAHENVYNNTFKDISDGLIDDYKTARLFAYIYKNKYYYVRDHKSTENGIEFIMGSSEIKLQ